MRSMKARRTVRRFRDELNFTARYLTSRRKSRPPESHRKKKNHAQETERQSPSRKRARASLPGAKKVGAPDPNDRVEVTVLLRRRSTAQARASVPEALEATKPHERHYLSHAEFAAAHGAAPQDIKRVEDFAHAHNLDVAETDAAGRRIVLSGTVENMQAAFGVELYCYEAEGVSYRGRTGAVHIPKEFESIVQGVFGLDDRPQAKPHFRILGQAEAVEAHNAGGFAKAHATATRSGGVAKPQAGAAGSFTPIELAKLYNFPQDASSNSGGAGQTIAIIELGGSYRAAELKKYFAELGIKKPPRVTAVAVDGGRNAPSNDPNSADGEVLLDIEVAGAIAPGANIVVYFAKNTDKGFLDAVTKAIHDPHRKPCAVSISWGAAEARWTEQAMNAFDQAFQDAAALGVTVCVASGDDGSGDAVGDGKQHVDFPASSPHALACGGTSLKAANGSIASETVWNDGANGGATGGGVSDFFALPQYQENAGVPKSANPGGRVGRGSPDVSGDADPNTGYRVLVDGQAMTIGGTSAVAPLWAGLVALLSARFGKPVGFLNPILYAHAGAATRDITQGNNGAYKAKKGWDACTGLGSPDGAKLLTILSGN